MSPSGTARRAAGLPRGRLRLLLFSTARTVTGKGMIAWPVPDDGTTVRDLVAELGDSEPGLAPILAYSRFFHDGVPVAGLDERVRPGEELAVHPPYGGG
jgi:molybdopterin converting factor small subunit